MSFLVRDGNRTNIISVKLKSTPIQMSYKYIIMIGDKDVGKTSIWQQFTRNEFSEQKLDLQRGQE